MFQNARNYAPPTPLTCISCAVQVRPWSQARMKQVHKEYEQPFLLEPTKLLRLVDTCHEQLRLQGPAKLCDDFEVFLSGNQRIELKSVDEVLALENSRRRAIE